MKNFWFNMLPKTQSSPGQIIDQYGINLLLVGFPKCGTTSIANWLAQSSEIEVSNPKETFLFTPEFGHNPYLPGGMPFTSQQPTTPYRLEASTLSIYSDQVLEDLQDRASVRVIIAGRNSARAIEAWHSQMVNAGRASQDDFTANLDRFSETLDSPESLCSYRSVGAFGTIANKWIHALGMERVFVLQQSDLNSSSPANILLTQLLGISSPGEVPSDNTRTGRRAPHVYNRLRSSSTIGKLKSRAAESELGSRALSGAKSILFDKQAQRASLPAELEPWFNDEDERFANLALANQKFHREAAVSWAA